MSGSLFCRIGNCFPIQQKRLRQDAHSRVMKMLLTQPRSAGECALAHSSASHTTHFDSQNIEKMIKYIRFYDVKRGRKIYGSFVTIGTRRCVPLF